MIGSLIGIGSSLIGGLLGSNSSSKAGNILSQAGSTAATNLNNTAAGANAGLGAAGAGAQNTLSAAAGAGQSGVSAGTTGAQNVVNSQMGYISPYQNAGVQGINSLASALAPGGSISSALNNNFSFNPSDLQNSPGYQFQLQQGLAQNKNAMAAMGLGNSGAAMKGATNYATGLAGTYFNTAYNQALNTYQTNRQNSLYQLSALQNLAGIGQNANQQGLAASEYIGNTGLQGQEFNANLGMQGAQDIANVGMQTALQQGNWSMGGQEAAMQAYMQGQAGKAAGVMGSGNAWQNALGGIGNGLMNMSAMNSIFGGGGAGLSPSSYMSQGYGMGLMQPATMGNNMIMPTLSSIPVTLPPSTSDSDFATTIGSNG